eukprot:TRINITY_DN23141_c0_g1_i1.p1 TRINITY_DN23141_c0_g1~~TRINITY_DN23141_c0_g1_i1.p1  ORF type:complete len:292 (-),score=22.21 TRINITY_DN23141_c0_g1_i1:134-940(-)
MYHFLASGPQALIFVVCLAHAPLGHRWDDFFKEFAGTIVMIVTQFPAGKWVARDCWWMAWLWHAAGVVGADWIAGGPNVNPSVAISMVALGKLKYSAFLCRVAAELAGGLVAFPLCRRFGSYFELPALGGPSFDHVNASVVGPAIDEFLATGVLCLAIYLMNWELAVKKYYLVKQSLTAIVIRFNLETFKRSGCAMNPMLGTTWAVFLSSSGKAGVYALPSEAAHYLCYWVASFAGALLSAFLYATIKGVPWFGWQSRKAASASKKRT